MGTAFSKLTNNLLAWVGNVVPPSFAKLLTQEAIRAIYDEHDWGFLVENSYLRLPKLVNAGTVNVVQFSPDITFDTTARAVIDTISENDVPIEERQFRTTQRIQSTRSFNYSIIDYDSVTGIMKINPPYQDVDNANAKFEILKMYYAPPWFTTLDANRNPTNPIIDFKGWEFVINPLWQRKIYLDITQEELNRFDPQRDRWTDDPRYLVPYSYTNDNEGNDVPLFELYPAPRIERVLKVQYKRRGITPKKPSDLVPFFDSELIVKKARIHAYEWILANTDKPAGKFLNMIGLLSNRNDPTSYPNLLQTHKDRDVESSNRTFMYDSLDYCDSLYSFGKDCVTDTVVLSF